MGFRRSFRLRSRSCAVPPYQDRSPWYVDDLSIGGLATRRSADRYACVLLLAEQEVGEATCDNDREIMDSERRHSRAALCESDEVENSDESSESRPSGERWAPVGANDGDNEFTDEYKYVNTNVDKYVREASVSPKNICRKVHNKPFSSKHML